MCVWREGRGAEIENLRRNTGRRGGAYAIPDKQPVIPSIPEGLSRRLRRLDANLRLGKRPTHRWLNMRRGVTSKH